MSTSYPYLVKNSRGSYNTEINGYEFTTFLMLRGIQGITDVQVIWNALNHSDVPIRGSNLSGIDPFLANCWLRDIGAEAVSKDDVGMTVRITLTWQQSRWGVLQIDAGAQLSQTETTNGFLDATATGQKFPTELSYIYPVTYGGDNPNAEQERLRTAGLQLQGGTVNFLSPEPSRIYTVRQTVDPTSVSQFYTGKVNSFSWQNGSPREWLCASITGTTDNSGFDLISPVSWINRYEFQFKKGGWDPEIVFTDQLTGDPVPDADLGVRDGVTFQAEKTVYSYELADFEDLFPAT